MYATSKLIIPSKIARDSPYVPKIRICLRPSLSLNKKTDMGSSLGPDEVLCETTYTSDNGGDRNTIVHESDRNSPDIPVNTSKDLQYPHSKQEQYAFHPQSRSTRKRKSLASCDNIDLEGRDSVLTRISLKTLINKETLDALPLESQTKLISLLPVYDRTRPPSPLAQLGIGKGIVGSRKQENDGQDSTVANSFWIHQTALTNEFLSKALQDYSARQLKGEFAPRINGRSGLRKTVGNRSRYPVISSTTPLVNELQCSLKDNVTTVDFLLKENMETSALVTDQAWGESTCNKSDIETKPNTNTTECHQINFGAIAMGSTDRRSLGGASRVCFKKSSASVSFLRRRRTGVAKRSPGQVASTVVLSNGPGDRNQQALQGVSVTRLVQKRKLLVSSSSSSPPPRSLRRRKPAAHSIAGIGVADELDGTSDSLSTIVTHAGDTVVGTSAANTSSIISPINVSSSLFDHMNGDDTISEMLTTKASRCPNSEMYRVNGRSRSGHPETLQCQHHSLEHELVGASGLALDSKSVPDDIASSLCLKSDPSLHLSTPEMPPPRQTKTLASLREKLRARRLQCATEGGQLSGVSGSGLGVGGASPLPGNLTPNLGLGHTENFCSSPCSNQSRYLSTTTTTHSKTMQSSPLSFNPAPLEIDPLLTAKLVVTSSSPSCDAFSGSHGVPDHHQPSDCQLLQPQHKSSILGNGNFPQSVSAPATPHHFERPTAAERGDRVGGPHSTTATPGPGVSPISKATHIFSNLRQARVVLAPAPLSAAPMASRSSCSSSCSSGTGETSDTLSIPSRDELFERSQPSLQPSPPVGQSHQQATLLSTSSAGTTLINGGGNASGTRNTRAFLVDGNNLSNAVALFQQINPQATVTQQQFYLLPTTDKSHVILCCPTALPISAVAQKSQSQLQTSQKQAKSKELSGLSMTTPQTLATVTSVSSGNPVTTVLVPPADRQASGCVSPRVCTSNAFSQSLPQPFTTTLVRSNHQGDLLDSGTGRRMSNHPPIVVASASACTTTSNLPLLLPATTKVATSVGVGRTGAGLLTDLPKSQPHVPVNQLPAYSTGFTFTPIETPSFSAYREILPSPIDTKLSAGNRVQIEKNSAATAASYTRLPQLAPNDSHNHQQHQRRLGVAYAEIKGGHMTGSTTYILNPSSSGISQVSLIDRNVVLPRGQSGALPQGVATFPVVHQSVLPTNTQMLQPHTPQLQPAPVFAPATSLLSPLQPSPIQPSLQSATSTMITLPTDQIQHNQRHQQQ